MNEFRKHLLSYDKFSNFLTLCSDVSHIGSVGVDINTSVRQINFLFNEICNVTCYIFIRNESLSTSWYYGVNSCDAWISGYSSILPQEVFDKLASQEQKFILKNIDVFTLDGFLNE